MSVAIAWVAVAIAWVAAIVAIRTRHAVSQLREMVAGTAMLVGETLASPALVCEHGVLHTLDCDECRAAADARDAS